MWTLFLWLVAAVAALDCSAKELDKYNFAVLQGTHSVESVKETPPSTTRTTWYFGICESVSGKVAAECPKNVDICGVTEVKVDKDYIVTQVVGFNSNLAKEYNAIDKKGKKGITISYKSANWGPSLVNADVSYVCASKDDDEFTVDSWDNDTLKAHINTRAGCITSKDEKKKPSKPEDGGESWGWFTWIFIFMVLFLSIYIIGGAWFQYNKGNAIDFQSALKEVMENFVDLVRGLPLFVREVIEKVTGSNRGEYSAV